MPVGLYEKKVQVRALAFQGYPPSDPLHMNEVMTFVQVPVSLDFTINGIILRIIFSSINVLEVRQGEYIVKDGSGKITIMTKAAFEAEYYAVPE